MLSDARNEKNFDDLLDDHKAKVETERKMQRIKFLRSEIDKSKKAIIDCINQNLFSFAKYHLERIDILNDEIDAINCTI
tara:strand:- start:2272 stop:2508 length:237 start_codon:yes stop_codon:yes gene_type:complete